MRFGPCKEGDRPAGLRFLGPTLGLRLKWIGPAVWAPSCAILGLQKGWKWAWAVGPKKQIMITNAIR